MKIIAENLKYRYPKSAWELEVEALELDTSEITAVIGANGSGKSTFGNLLAGINRPTAGMLSIKMPIKDSTESITTMYSDYNLSEFRQLIGIIFQDPSAGIVYRKVYDDIAFMLKNLKIDKSEHSALIKTALNLVGIDGFENRNPLELSLGQRQKFAIATGLAARQKYLVLDEITSMLDHKSRINVLEIVHSIKQMTGSLLITNNIDDLAIADRVIVFDEGKIIYDEPSENEGWRECIL
jgi:energy-coupling factor transport system ATP-binding protein